MQRIQVTVKNLQKILPLDLKKIKEIALKVFSLEGSGAYGEVTILFVNDRQIRTFNRKYAGKDSATDVLAFNSADAAEALLADVIVSADTALVNARRYHTSPWYELSLYVVHGLLHLLGYDDASPVKRKKMHQKATGLLDNLTPHRCFNHNAKQCLSIKRRQ